TRVAGTIDESELARYNDSCRQDTHYQGPNISPSDAECRQYTTGELIDPAKIQRLQALTTQYLARLSQGELTLADAQRIDTALRRAYAALRRGWAALPGIPAPVEAPRSMRPDGPAVPFVAAGMAARALAPAAAETVAGGTAAAGAPTLT